VSQPREGCDEFQDRAHELSIGPTRSWWPSIAEPSVPLFVQLPHVMSGNGAPGYAVPSGREPVSMSCMLGFSVLPLTIRPFSSSAVSFVTLLPAECRSSTLLAITTPFAFCQGPLPMRSRALT